MKNISTVYHCGQRLEVDDLLPRSAHCPWCASLERRGLVSLQEAPDVTLMECKECHAVSASHMPTPDALNAYYAGYYSRTEATRGPSLVTIEKPQRFARYLASLATLSRLNGDIKIMDFGGGDGTIAVHTAMLLLEESQVRSVHITIVDYVADFATYSDDRISIDSLSMQDEFERTEYDLVIASAVIEHIPSAPEILARLLSAVRVNGIFYARTPQVSSFVKLLSALGLQWDFTFPAHVYDLGQQFWERHFSMEPYASKFSVLVSKPSIVEASLTASPIRAVLSYAFKLPWYVLGKSWGFVGGWEVAASRTASKEAS